MEFERALKIHREQGVANRLGFYSAMLAFIAATGYCIAQLLQVAGIIRFPLDAYLIYGFSLGIATPYVVAVIVLHHTLPERKKIWSHIAIAFALMYAMYVNLNYVVQLATVVPAARQEALNELRLLDQTPHSLFWDVDALGYICMGISTFFLSFAFTPQWKWLRTFLFANGMMVPVIAFVYFYSHFSTAILFIGLPWIITAPGSLLLLAVFFLQKDFYSDLSDW